MTQSTAGKPDEPPLHVSVYHHEINRRQPKRIKEFIERQSGEPSKPSLANAAVLILKKHGLKKFSYPCV